MGDDGEITGLADEGMAEVFVRRERAVSTFRRGLSVKQTLMSGARIVYANGSGQITKDFLQVNHLFDSKKMIKNKYFLSTVL
jgi:hypothetical protein